MKIGNSSMAWHAEIKPLAGQAVSGDQYLAEAVGGGVLFAVSDGLGHGAEAYHASQTALAAIRESGSAGLTDLMRTCHESLKGTRGAALTIAFVNFLNGTLSWIAVGNVVAILFRKDERPASLLLRAGIVGDILPLLQASETPIDRGDTLVISTDGIEPAVLSGLNTIRTPEQIAGQILSRGWTGKDDALVLVARLSVDSGELLP